MKVGNATLVKGKKLITIKTRKKKEKKPEEKPEEVKEEAPIGEEVAEAPAEEAPAEEVKEEVIEEPTEEERVKGTVKFFNPNKGFGFITGDDGKDYYIHESGLKEGVTIKTEDRVSFKIVQGYKNPKAEEVEKIDKNIEELEE